MPPAARPSLITLGEALVDLVAVEATGPSLADATLFARAAGGAPANVAVGAARLGVGTSFVGRVGADPFGDHLLATLADEGVDVSLLRRDPAARTALAFVALGDGGERDFFFYRQGAADTRLEPADVDEGYLAGAHVLHVGTLSLTAEPSRSATLHALALAERHGVTRSLDPNLRLDLWPSPAAAREAVLTLLPRVNLLKLSAEELAFLVGDPGLEAARALCHPGLELLCVTRGAGGVDYLARSGPAAAGATWRAGHVPGFSVTALDTTGAGDAFMAALLAAWCAHPPGGTALSADPAALEAALRRANAYAALTVTRHGAIPALPERAELEAFLARAGGPPA